MGNNVLGGFFDFLDTQGSRFNNAVSNAFGGGVKTDPKDYDWKGSMTPEAQRQRQVGSPAAPVAQSAYDIGAGKAAPLVLSPQARADWKPGSSATVQAIQGTLTPNNAMQGVWDGVAARQQQYKDLYGRVLNQANPYDGTYEKNRIAQAQGGIRNQYANAERQTMEGQAARGMLGSGQSEGALNVLNAERGNAYASATQQALDDTYNRRAGFEDQRTNQLMQLNNGDFSGTQSAIEQALMLPGKLDSQKLGIAMQRTGLTAAEAQAKIAQYEASDAQWDRENPVAAFLRDFSMGTANGVGQGIGKAVAGG